MTIVASVDYIAKRIYLHADTVDTVLDTMDIYREVRTLRRVVEDHRKFRPIIVGGGNIQKTPTTKTAPYVQLLYGTRIVPYDAVGNLQVIRDTFTDDGAAGIECFDRSSVANEVDIDYNVDKVEVRIVSGGSGLDAAQDAKLTAINASSTLAAALLRNKRVLNIASGVETIYADDDVTPLYTRAVWVDANGTVQYDGTLVPHRVDRYT